MVTLVSYFTKIGWSETLNPIIQQTDWYIDFVKIVDIKGKHLHNVDFLLMFQPGTSFYIYVKIQWAH
jgi:hypothetical protein